MNDLKDYHQNWWDRKVVLGITWNHLILAMVVLALIIGYSTLDGNWVSGLR